MQISKQRNKRANVYAETEIMKGKQRRSEEVQSEVL